MLIDVDHFKAYNDFTGHQAGDRALRMRRAVARLGLEHGGSHSGVVTISAGVALVEPSSTRRSRGAVQLADQALYEAKTRGRNRVKVLDPGAHQALTTGVFSRSTINGG